MPNAAVTCAMVACTSARMRREEEESAKRRRKEIEGSYRKSWVRPECTVENKSLEYYKQRSIELERRRAEYEQQKVACDNHDRNFMIGVCVVWVMGMALGYCLLSYKLRK